MSKLAKILLLAGVAMGAGEALAGDASPWVKANFAKTRLIAGQMEGAAGKTQILAGVQIKLDDGWKTYWRNPGDSGLPPSFNWEGSKNVKDATVLWPVPHRFSDQYGTSIGYSEEVVFPVELTPVRSGEAIELKLKLDYAICKDICVPAQADLDLKLDQRQMASAGAGRAIWRFKSLVPEQAGGQSADLPQIKSIQPALEAAKPRIVVEADFPGGTDGADLFAEGGEEIYLPPPQSIEKIDAKRVRFTINLAKDTDLAALAERDVRWTLVTKTSGTETVQGLK